MLLLVSLVVFSRPRVHGVETIALHARVDALLLQEKQKIGLAVADGVFTMGVTTLCVIVVCSFLGDFSLENI